MDNFHRNESNTIRANHAEHRDTRKVISFPTVSKDSNLDLIEFVEGYLTEHGISSKRVPKKNQGQSSVRWKAGSFSPDIPVFRWKAALGHRPFCADGKSRPALRQGNLHMKGGHCPVIDSADEKLKNRSTSFSYDEETLPRQLPG